MTEIESIKLQIIKLAQAIEAISVNTGCYYYILDEIKEMQQQVKVEPEVKPANGGHSGECRVCFEKDRILHHFDLYVTGSEGIWMCEECRMILTENIRIIKADNLHKKLKREKESRLSV